MSLLNNKLRLIFHLYILVWFNNTILLFTERIPDGSLVVTTFCSWGLCTGVNSYSEVSSNTVPKSENLLFSLLKPYNFGAGLIWIPNWMLSKRRGERKCGNRVSSSLYNGNITRLPNIDRLSCFVALSKLYYTLWLEISGYFRQIYFKVIFFPV